MMITELLNLHAQQQPAKAAVITDEGSLTYAELEQAVESMAQFLLGRGLRRGNRVAMHWHNSIDLVVLMLGAFRAGLVAVPINPRLKAAEISYILEHSGAQLCFSEPDLAPRVSGVEVLTQLPSLTAACGQFCPHLTLARRRLCSTRPERRRGLKAWSIRNARCLRAQRQSPR
jgi:acyl-CoA synthetase (AMP-forming)/AMP-acid ligase II